MHCHCLDSHDILAQLSSRLNSIPHQWAVRQHTVEGQCKDFKIAPIDCGAEEDEVGPQHGLHQGQWNGGCLIDDQQLRLPQPLMVLRLNVLHRLQATEPVNILT